MNTDETYLRAILATVARQTFPLRSILEIVAGEKQRRAYNLCDGTRSQSEIVNEAGLDKGNFSKTLSRWIDSGIAIRVGSGKDARPVHVYPIPESEIKNSKD